MDQDQEITIFRPRYPIPYRLGFLALPILFFGLLCNGISAPRDVPIFYWYLALICGVCTAFLPFFFIREVRFVNDMVIRRYFLPDIFVNYKETYTIQGDRFYIKNRDIRLGRLENLEEFKEMAKVWLARQTLKGARLPSSFRLIFPARGHGSYAAFWGFALGIIITILGSTWPVDPRWPPGITFVIVYFMFVYIVPAYL